MSHVIRILLAGASLLLSVCVFASEEEKAELGELLDSFLIGASANDAAVHERFWADELIYTSSDGRRFGKAEIMASLEATDRASETEAAPDYSARDVTIKVFGDTAVVTFRLMARQNGELVGEYFNTGVFRRGEPGWQAVTWQATRVGEVAGE